MYKASHYKVQRVFLRHKANTRNCSIVALSLLVGCIATSPDSKNSSSVVFSFFATKCIGNPIIQLKVDEGCNLLTSAAGQFTPSQSATGVFSTKNGALGYSMNMYSDLNCQTLNLADPFIQQPGDWVACDACATTKLPGIHLKGACVSADAPDVVLPTCPSKEDMDLQLAWITLLITTVGVGISCLLVWMLMRWTKGAAFEGKGEGCAFWTHLLVHFSTALVTIAMQIARDNYQQTVKIAGGTLMMRWTTGYWSMDGEVWGAPGTNVPESKDEMGMHCCLASTGGAYLGELSNPVCTQLRLQQGSSIIVIILATAAGGALVCQRYKLLGFERWGYLARLVFAMSTLISVVGVALMVVMKNELDMTKLQDGVEQESKPVFKAGFFLYVVAVALKVVASLFLAYEYGKFKCRDQQQELQDSEPKDIGPETSVEIVSCGPMPPAMFADCMARPCIPNGDK